MSCEKCFLKFAQNMMNKNFIEFTNIYNVYMYNISIHFSTFLRGRWMVEWQSDNQNILLLTVLHWCSKKEKKRERNWIVICEQTKMCHQEADSEQKSCIAGYPYVRPINWILALPFSCVCAYINSCAGFSYALFDSRI